MENSNLYYVIDAYLKKNCDYSEEQLKSYFAQEPSVDRLLEVYCLLERTHNKKAHKIKGTMENIIGEKYIEKYGVIPREAMALGLLEKTLGLEILNDDDYPSLHHVHAAFRTRNGYIYDIDIVEVECPKVKFLNLLPNLEMLTIYIAGLREIEGLEHLSKLESLDLAVNDLTEVQGLEHLKKLKKLYLYRNKISQLNGLESLEELEELLIHENPISKLKGIKKLKGLKYIEFDETNLPESTKKEIFSHIKRNYSRIDKEKIKKLHVAEKFKNQGEYDKAIVNYKRVIKLAMILLPSGWKHQHLLSSKDWYNLAISYLKIHNYDEALNSCMQAIKLNSKDKRAQELRKRLVNLIKNKN